MTRDTTRRRGSFERGNVLVEMALVLFPLTVVFGGIIDFGNIHQQRISLRNGVREASWNGGRSIYGATPSCSITGGPSNVNARRLICLAKHRTNLPDADLRIRVEIIDPISGANTTFALGNSVMICAQHKVRSLSGLYSGLLGNKVEKMRLDNVILDTSGGTLPTNAGETTFAGQNWTWCSGTAAATP